MNAVTETAEITTETTAFQRSVLRAMLELAGSNTSNEIAKQAGVKSEPVRVCLARLRDAGLIGTEVNPDRGGPPLWHLRASVDTVRSMVAAPIPSANDGTPGDDEPAPEPGDTQAEDRRRAVLEALREAPEANADSIASATGLSVSEARFFLHAMAADGIVERIEHENAGAIRRNPTIWRIVDADQPGDTQVVDAAEAAPVPDHSASLDDPDNFGDDEMQTAAPDPDGWIPWNGGDCPVPEGGTCWVRLRDGSVVFADKPLNLAWGRCDILASPERRAVAPDEPLSPVWVRRNHPRDIVAYRLDTPAHLITPAYSAAVTAESAVDAAPLTGDDVCSTDAAIANWKREHAPAAPAATDGEPGDGTPAPEPDDTQAVEASEPTLMSDTAELQPSVEPVAETQAAEADADGWIPWRGGECPVPVGSRCSIRLRNADVAHCIRDPEAWWWGRAAERTADLSDIIAYRPEPKQTGSASFDDPDDYGDDEIPPAAPDPDGWIPWRGGERPVDADQRVAIRLVSGKMLHGRAGDFIWSWNFCDGDCADYTTGGNIVAYRLDTPAHLIAPAYSAAVATESAADSAPLTGDDVCSADAVIANWKREHTPAVPTIAPADPFAVWLADTPAGCAGQRAIDAAEQEAARLRAEAAEMVREAAEALEFGLIVAEIIRFADQRNASTSTSEAEFGLAELMAAAYEAVTGKRVA